MDPAEVLAVEIKQYVGQNLRTLVPRVIGRTSDAERKKSTGAREEKQWNEISFLEELTAQRGSQEVQVAKGILEWAIQMGLRMWWGKGSKDGSFFPVLDHKGISYLTISVWTSGRLEVQFQYMRSRPPFDSETKGAELRRRLNQVLGILIPEDATTRRPRIPLSTLVKPEVLKQFLEVLDWVIQEIRAS